MSTSSPSNPAAFARLVPFPPPAEEPVEEPVESSSDELNEDTLAFAAPWPAGSVSCVVAAEKTRTTNSEQQTTVGWDFSARYPLPCHRLPLAFATVQLRVICFLPLKAFPFLPRETSQSQACDASHLELHMYVGVPPRHTVESRRIAHFFPLFVPATLSIVSILQPALSKVDASAAHTVDRDSAALFRTQPGASEPSPASTIKSTRTQGMVSEFVPNCTLASIDLMLRSSCRSYTANQRV